jgi:hypothetical protein
MLPMIRTAIGTRAMAFIIDCMQTVVSEGAAIQ